MFAFFDNGLSQLSRENEGTLLIKRNYFSARFLHRPQTLPYRLRRIRARRTGNHLDRRAEKLPLIHSAAGHPDPAAQNLRGGVLHRTFDKPVPTVSVDTPLGDVRNGMIDQAPETDGAGRVLGFAGATATRFCVY